MKLFTICIFFKIVKQTSPSVSTNGWEIVSWNPLNCQSWWNFFTLRPPFLIRYLYVKHFPTRTLYSTVLHISRRRELLFSVSAYLLALLLDIIIAVVVVVSSGKLGLVLCTYTDPLFGTIFTRVLEETWSNIYYDLGAVLHTHPIYPNIVSPTTTNFM